eukprot:gene11666-11753_t
MKGADMILEFSLMDALALLFFAASWSLYNYVVELSPSHEVGLNNLMDVYRQRWMDNMRIREVRIVDTQIMGSLQNGTAFFASTSLLAIGASATLLRATDDVLQVFRDLPFGLVTTRALWEIKAAGLMVIFGYAFFKFSWSYRLFNYAAILLGATPMWNSPDEEERNRVALRTSRMTALIFGLLIFILWIYVPVNLGGGGDVSSLMTRLGFYYIQPSDQAFIIVFAMLYSALFSFVADYFMGKSGFGLPINVIASVLAIGFALAYGCDTHGPYRKDDMQLILMLILLPPFGVIFLLGMLGAIFRQFGGVVMARGKTHASKNLRITPDGGPRASRIKAASRSKG